MPQAHSAHHRLGTSCLPFSLLFLSVPSRKLLQLRQERLTSPGSLPGGGGLCVAVIRGNCWEAGCHGAAEARAALPGCPGFLGCPTITAARGTHGEGGEASSLLTGIVQRKVRGPRPRRRVRLAQAEHRWERDPGGDWSLPVVFAWLRCAARVPSAGSKPTDSQACPECSWDVHAWSPRNRLEWME